MKRILPIFAFVSFFAFQAQAQIYTLNGKLGVGTTPITQLDIAGDFRTTGDAWLNSDVTVGGILELEASLKMPNAPLAPGELTLLRQDANGFVTRVTIDDFVQELFMLDPCGGGYDLTIPIWHSGTNKVFVGTQCEDDVKVGINTWNPNFDLEVIGNSRISDEVLFGSGSSTGMAQVEIIPSSTRQFALSLKSGASTGGLQAYVGASTEKAIVIENTALNADVFEVFGDGTLHNKGLFVESGSNTEQSIVLTNSVTNNDVLRIMGNGHIYTTGVYVRLENNFPDYVFEDDYELMGLYELEAFIKQNRHLPNMPTAEKVASDGLDLGETERLLTEKVEELTLYVIQLKKELDALKEQQESMTQPAKK